MKKLLFTFAATAFITIWSQAQTNLDYENWGSTLSSSNDPTGWGTFNLDAIGGPTSTFQDTANPGPGGGLSAVHMVSTSGYTAFLGIDIVGGFVSLGGDILNNAVGGVPYTQKPYSVEFEYKSNVAAGDTGVFIAQLTHWDGTQQVFDAQALVTFEDPAVNVWTSNNVVFTYFTTDTPDTLIILAVSSQEALFTTPAGVAGSELYLDNMVIHLVPVSAPEMDEKVKFSVYPNPASGHVVIKNGSSRSDMDVEMIDINGKLVRSYTDVAGGEMTIDGNGLARGSYFVKVTSGGKQVIKQVIFQ